MRRKRVDLEAGSVMSENMMSFKSIIRDQVFRIPLLSWLLGVLIAVSLERLLGTPLAESLGLPKIPVLFGFVIMLS